LGFRQPYGAADGLPPLLTYEPLAVNGRQKADADGKEHDWDVCQAKYVLLLWPVLNRKEEDA